VLRRLTREQHVAARGERGRRDLLRRRTAGDGLHLEVVAEEDAVEAVGEGLVPRRAVLGGAGLEGLRNWKRRKTFFLDAIALFDTVITITISVTLALLAIRLGVEMWLDSGHDS